MRVALLNRPEDTHIGGDMVRLKAYISELNKLNIQADYYSSTDTPDLSKYDMVWLFHLDFGWSVQNYQTVKKYNIPYILFCIYYTHLKNVKVELQREIVLNAKSVFTESKREYLELVRDLTLPESLKVIFIQNGYDPDIFQVGPTPVKDRQYVLISGRFEQFKGQHKVLQVCKDLNIPVMAVGPGSNSEYGKQCRSINPSAIIQDAVSQKELGALMQNARVYVCASDHERNSLAVVEALACGCRVISSAGNRGADWYSNVLKFRSTDELRSQIQFLWNNEVKQDTIYTWYEIVQHILKEKSCLKMQ